MTSDHIHRKLVDEEDGLYSYSHNRIDFFDIEDSQLDFFIQTDGNVMDRQIETIQYILRNTVSIEGSILPNIEKMLADFLNMKDDEIEVDSIELGTVFIPVEGIRRFVLGFESCYDDHGYEVLMEGSKIIDQGKEFSF